RIVVAIAAIFFAIQHFLHPEFAPGVPLLKVTPAWIPLRPFWGYLTGVILLIAGAALLINKKARMAAAPIGLLMAILALLLYVPILAMASQPPQMLEGINYVADTLLFAGAALLVAGAQSASRLKHSLVNRTSAVLHHIGRLFSQHATHGNQQVVIHTDQSR